MYKPLASNVADVLTTISRSASRFALYISITGLVLMTFVIVYQVLARYVFGDAASWSEQLALLLMLWFILFAAAAGVREGFHIRISILQDAMNSSKRTALCVTCHAIVSLFALAMVWGGSQLVVATWSHTIPALGIPRGTAYLPLPGAGVLMALFSIEHIVATFRGKEITPLWS